MQLEGAPVGAATGRARMDYDKLKLEIKAIAEIANEAPEPFRARAFELLLQHLLDSAGHQHKGGHHKKEEPTQPPGEAAPRTGDGSQTLALPAQVKVFLQKTGVTQDELKRVIMVEDGEVHFIREPTTQKIARGQIEWALLLALRNGILTNNLAVDPESVRSICQEKGFYDRPNFSTNFKAEKNAALFSGPMEAQGAPQKLSSEGQQELGRVIKALIA